VEAVYSIFLKICAPIEIKVSFLAFVGGDTQIFFH
jgi:hypothetical protein